ncbi:hypothetical protein AGR4C_Lc80058 [Agrobacterium tumefaciens str. Kerr 14]|uniref:Uncharacterized protein n=1 Tax=Agrobacterium tumefaciens str. Kerr 14 TaxID=1183424 RepID=A0A1S7S3X1_AGRTU|nr:hypothetical protein AGR4C_Lc80058 [Agrobacterium tumefaciens str. Kerr 14]
MRLSINGEHHGKPKAHLLANANVHGEKVVSPCYDPSVGSKLIKSFRYLKIVSLFVAKAGCSDNLCLNLLPWSRGGCAKHSRLHIENIGVACAYRLVGER